MLFFFNLQNVYQISALTQVDIQGMDVKFEFHPAMSFGELKEETQYFNQYYINLG